MNHRHLLAVALLLSSTAACGTTGSGDDEVSLVVGYQSKTINTVNAGTLLRARGYLEKRLAEAGKASGKTYAVNWKDYDTGAPITAQMLAGRIDIGSMGDYPLLINGSKTGGIPDGRTEFIATTGYNAKGALNSVVVAPDSPAKTLADLKGTKVSASVGSAGHGLLVRALDQAGVRASDVKIQNQGPPVGASALQSGSVDAYSQFVAWPGLLVFKDQARLLYDGANANVPTFHGVVARKAYSTEHPEVVDAFLKAVRDATDEIHAKPLAAAQEVAKRTGLPAEVVYLYNGANGISTFDTTIKPLQREAFAEDVPFLKAIGVLKTLDLKSFVNDSYLRKAYGPAYEADIAKTANPAAITGKDEACGGQVSDAATAGEIWLDGENATHPASDAACLLRFVKSAQAAGKKVRAAYIPAADTGTRWFADKLSWVHKGAELRPFTTRASAEEYAGKNPGASVVSYETALAKAGR